MLIIPKSDITKIGIFIGLIGAFILAKNYFPLSIERMSLEGRMQFGGNSFIMKNKIIAKYNAWVGFSLVAIATIMQLIAIHLDKYTTWGDLKGRSVFFANPLNILATCAFLFLVLRVSIFITDAGARREYYPFLKEREKDNFKNATKKINSDKPEMAKDARREIDQLLLLFDIKIKKQTSYDIKINKLKEKVFK